MAHSTKYSLTLQGPQENAPPLRRAWEDTPEAASKVAAAMTKALRPGYRLTVELSSK